MSQLDLFGNRISVPPPANLIKQTTQINQGSFQYYCTFFSRSESDEFFSRLLEDIEWKQESMRIYGKLVSFPRLTAWYGDNDKPYSFSGITLKPHPWSKDLLKIKSAIEEYSTVVFNSVLLNLYRSGNDSISWHTDAEPELGRNPVIASVNFGETRKFQLRHIKTREVIDIQLEHGSVLIMEGELQHYWQHQVPKTKAAKKERINLTFRVIK
ncbi:MAG: alpha-ketoglutarate-dependent dioxygenase AlkB [Ignavibacteriales bacterium]